MENLCDTCIYRIEFKTSYSENTEPTNNIHCEKTNYGIMGMIIPECSHFDNGKTKVQAIEVHKENKPEKISAVLEESEEGIFFSKKELKKLINRLTFR